MRRDGPLRQTVAGTARSTAAPASSQFRCLIAFLDAHEAPIEDNASRLSRGRAAVRDVLAALAAAHAAHDDPPMAIAETGGQHSPVDRGTHLCAGLGQHRRSVRRRSGGAIRRIRRDRRRRSHRRRVAGASETEHLLPGLAAGVARLAHGKGPPRGRRGAVPRAAAVADRAREGFDRQPGRRSARGAFHIRRRDSASEAADCTNRSAVRAP